LPPVAPVPGDCVSEQSRQGRLNFIRPWRDSGFLGPYTRQFLPGYSHAHLSVLVCAERFFL
jgi:hypothetical protein